MNEVEELLADCSRNLPAFEEHEDSLEQEHCGKFALYREGELIGVFDSADEADSEGARRGAYAVFKIGRQPLRYAILA